MLSRDSMPMQKGKLAKTLKRFREDKGGEYMSTEFDTFLKSCGTLCEK